MIAKQHLEEINKAFNSYIVATTMFDDADNVESRRLWAEYGIEAWDKIAAYGIQADEKPCIRFRSFMKWDRITDRQAQRELGTV